MTTTLTNDKIIAKCMNAFLYRSSISLNVLTVKNKINYNKEFISNDFLLFAVINSLVFR